MAVLNISVSFALAFSVAMNARNVREMTRRRIYRALARRLARSPLLFILPAAAQRRVRRAREAALAVPDDTTRYIS
jgi:site-specific recombinase